MPDFHTKKLSFLEVYLTWRREVLVGVTVRYHQSRSRYTGAIRSGYGRLERQPWTPILLTDARWAHPRKIKLLAFYYVGFP